MPVAAMHPCPRCGTAIPRKERLCRECAPIAAARAEAERGSSRDRGYTWRWQKYRDQYLNQHPLCVLCAAYSRTTLAEVVDHVVPHRGDEKLFWNPANHQALCAACHNRKTYLEDGGLAGAAVLPMTMSRTVVPLVVIAGAPGAGKTTLLRRLASQGDLALDLDEIRERLCVVEGTDDDQQQADALYGRAMAYRNQRLQQLCTAPCAWQRGWLIASTPTAAARAWWRARAGAQVVVLGTPLEQCLARIANDRRRPTRAAQQAAAAARHWWATYQPDSTPVVDDSWAGPERSAA